MQTSEDDLLKSLIIGLTVIAVGTTAAADDEIELDLRRPQVTTEKPQTEPQPPPSVPDRRGGVRAAPQRSGEKVVGRLGVVSADASIYRGRGFRTAELARVKAGVYLAINREADGWFGVLMADRSVGWMHAKTVRILQYEVLAPDTPHVAERGPDTGSMLMTGGQRSLLNVAYQYLGVPYKWGGTSPNGLDCSAFVQRCFNSLGVRLPRTAREQFACGVPVDPSSMQAADRIYFAGSDGRITHTGIYIGNGYFIHSAASRKGVAIDRLDSPMYRKMFAGARR
jgi:hypothetical protein